ncbi:MAG TPA: hypothetical protein VGF29_04315 [Hyphomicrobiaceae bacterium]|jgi:hypothetical protein
MHHDDLNQVLTMAFPQGTALLKCENGMELLNHGTRSLISTPSLAYEVLGAKTTAALSRAVRSLGQRYLAIADRLDELVAGGPSTPPRACSGATAERETP